MATFTESFTRMRQDFDRAQAERTQLFRDTREHVKNMARGMQEQLAGFRHDMQNIREDISQEADHVRTGLRELKRDLHTGGNGFRKETSSTSQHQKSQ